MKVVIAGSRQVTDQIFVISAIERSGFQIKEVVSGGARGVDKLADKWASDNAIPVKVFESDWERYGKAAGPIRNKMMAEYADALIAIWDGKSRGTKNIISTAEKLGLSVFVHKLDSDLIN